MDGSEEDTSLWFVSFEDCCRDGAREGPLEYLVLFAPDCKDGFIEGCDERLGLIEAEGSSVGTNTGANEEEGPTDAKNGLSVVLESKSEGREDCIIEGLNDSSEGVFVEDGDGCVVDDRNDGEVDDDDSPPLSKEEGRVDAGIGVAGGTLVCSLPPCILAVGLIVGVASKYCQPCCC